MKATYMATMEDGNAGHKISSEVAAGIFNHYYSEAGFDVNGLWSSSVTPQVAGNERSGWQVVGLTEYGNQYTGLTLKRRAV